uniref:Uncharacterized protein n=1 Tax=Magallana gigas TaxID=29159 RepID=A0A8W8KXB4_MAGGI
LLFPAFGFAMWKLGDPDFSNPFYGYSFGMPLTQGVLFILIFVVYGVYRCREPKNKAYRLGRQCTHKISVDRFEFRFLRKNLSCCIQFNVAIQEF